MIPSCSVVYIFVLGKGKLKFLPRRFVTPPLEFRHLYGREMRQTSLEDLLVKIEPKKTDYSKKKCIKLVQSRITRFFSSSK